MNRRKSAQANGDKEQPLGSPIAQYVREIELYETETEGWKKRRDDIQRRYKDQRNNAEASSAKFNIFWSMVQTEIPAIFAKNPKPDFQRRFYDDDPVGRIASTVLERVTSYFVNTDEFFEVVRQSELDYELGGRGTLWLRYNPTIVQDGLQVDDDDLDGTGGDNMEAPVVEKLAYEDVDTDYVHPDDFGHNICRTWQEVWLVWRTVYLTREELIARFGKEKGALPPLDHNEQSDKRKPVDDGIGKAIIFECWDKSKKKAIWLHKSIREPLDERDDPLRLKDFFPAPKPFYSVLGNDSLIPVPFYYEYQDQARELDTLTARIKELQKGLKLVGVYDSSAQGIDRMLSEGMENTLIPVDQWAVFAERGGVKGAIDFLPLEQVALALKSCYEAREQVKNDLYEISGMADIIRGVSDPQETLGAQEIKSNFATMRISERQAEMQRFIRRVIRLMVDIICGHFKLETIQKISGVRLLTAQEKQLFMPYKAGMPAPQPQAQQMGGNVVALNRPPPLPSGISLDQMQDMLSDPSWEEVEALIRNEPLRCFRLDIETDSTIKSDQQQEKAERSEFLKGVGTFLQQAVAAPPEMQPLLGRLLMFAIRAFPVGKDLEGAFQSFIDQIERQNQSGQPKPNPEMVKIQAQAQADQLKLQNDFKLKQFQAQLDAQTDAQKAQADAAVQQHLNTLENQRELAKLQGEQAINREKLSMERQTEIEKAHIQARAQIEVARITAKLSTGEEAEEQETAAEGEDPLPEFAPPSMPEAPQQPQQPAQPQHAPLHPEVINALNQMVAAHQKTAGGLSALQEAMARSISGMDQLHKAVTSEKEIVRDPKTGKPTGVRVKPDKQEIAKQLRNRS